MHWKAATTIAVLLVPITVAGAALLLWKSRSTPNDPASPRAAAPAPDGIPSAAAPADSTAASSPSPPPTTPQASAAQTRSPSAIYMVGDSDACRWTHDRCKELGLTVTCCGDAAFEKWIPSTPGFTLIVASVGGRTCLPEKYAHLLPREDLAIAAASRPSGVLSTRTDGGTRVYVVFGADRAALRAEFKRFEFRQ